MAAAREDLEKRLATGNSIDWDMIKTVLDYNISLLGLSPEDLDCHSMMMQLEREFLQEEPGEETGGTITVLTDREKPTWLTPSRKKNRPLWSRYKRWLKDIKGNWSRENIAYLDESTDAILEQLGDPLKNGWNIRGLVVGDVQSGKTSNYTGLICKAADAGYKLIIVLAGTGKDLRKQTQIRLEEGFIGKNTQTQEPIGVGLVDREVLTPNSFTTNEIDGDFSADGVRHHFNVTTDTNKPSLFVVKKNSTILQNLAKWIENENSVKNLPLLLIDDEADNATINNKAKKAEVSAINGSVRSILKSFNKSSYVGYTATPFANVLINPDANDANLGRDIYPSDFIINLKAPANYFGPSLLFGPQDEPEMILPLIRHIEDKDEWLIKGKISIEAIEDVGLLPSLMQAILEFLLGCAARNLRGEWNEHTSMLIHVDKGTEIQETITDFVNDFINKIDKRIKAAHHKKFKNLLKELYENNLTGFKSILKKLGKMRRCKNIALSDTMPQFHKVWEKLPEILDTLEIIMRNSATDDILDYEHYKQENGGKGMNVIVIGGNALSRGLTLEGLTVSYFLRDAKYYDTIMQMARWFGYRDGYLDLCRIYMTKDMEERYRWIATATEELRSEFEMAAKSHVKPKDYGFYIRKHPVIKITSRILNTDRENSIVLSYAGRLEQTLAFSDNWQVREKNLEALNHLVESIGEPAFGGTIRKDFPNRRNWQGFLWEDMEHEKVIKFLKEYAYAPGFHRFNPGLVADYIQRMAKEHKELTSWTVALLGRRGGNDILEYEVADEFNINCRFMSGVKRKFLAEDGLRDIYTLRTVISEEDEALDLSLKQWEIALALSRELYKEGRLKVRNIPEEPVGSAIREIRGKCFPQNGLLLLYPLDIRDSETGESVDADYPFTAFAISFPTSVNAAYGEYIGDKTLIDRLTGAGGAE